MNRLTTANLYLNPRMAILLGLGFASGLPLQLTQDALAAWLSAADVDVTTIGLFAMVTLPYSLKFIWAPLMDRYRLPVLSRRRGWLMVTQLLLIAGIIMMAAFGPDRPYLLAIAALVVAFLSASQDIVSDAYRTDILRPREFGAGVAMFVLGYRVALIATGAGVLMLAGFMGWRQAFILMGMLMDLGVLFTLAAKEPPQQERTPTTITQAVVEPFQSFMAHRSWWIAGVLMLFVLIFRLPDTLGNRMTMPFLLQEMKFTPETVGFIRQFIGIWVVIAGTFIGGWFISRIGIRAGLLIFGLLQAISNAGFLLLAWWGASQTGLVAVILIESFCGGLVTAGFLAFLMSQCDPRYSATQYALLTSLMAVTGILAGAWTGLLVSHVGYMGFFVITIAAGLPGILLIPFLPKPVQRIDPDATPVMD